MTSLLEILTFLYTHNRSRSVVPSSLLWLIKNDIEIWYVSKKNKNISAWIWMYIFTAKYMNIFMYVSNKEQRAIWEKKEWKEGNEEYTATEK